MDNLVALCRNCHGKETVKDKSPRIAIEKNNALRLSGLEAFSYKL